MEIMEPKLESLLMEKPFERLHADERSYVSGFLTKEEYDSYHLILKHTFIDNHQLDSALEPLPENAEKLRKLIRANKNTAFTFKLSFKKLSIAALLLISVSLGGLLFRTNHLDKSKLKPKLANGSHNISRYTPKPETVEILKKPLPRKILANSTRKKLLTIKHIHRVEKPDSIGVPDSDKFYGLHVQEPLLGLDINLDDSLLGLRTRESRN